MAARPGSRHPADVEKPAYWRFGKYSLSFFRLPPETVSVSLRPESKPLMSCVHVRGSADFPVCAGSGIRKDPAFFARLVKAA